MAETLVTIALVLDPADPWLPRLASQWPVWVPDAPASQAAAGAYDEPEWHDAGVRRAGVSFVPVAPGGPGAEVIAALLARAGAETKLARVGAVYVSGASPDDPAVSAVLHAAGYPHALVGVVRGQAPTAFTALRHGPAGVPDGA